MFKEDKINNTDMLDYTESTVRSISNSISFTLMKCQVHQEEEKSTKILDSVLKFHSILFLD